jgi:hypothetical protein
MRSVPKLTLRFFKRREALGAARVVRRWLSRVQLKLVVSHLEGTKELPIVELRRAA